MTKLLQNKSIIKFLGIALSILLIVALVPQINIAYGSKDDVLADTGTEESVEDTDDLEGAEDAENAEGEEEGVLSEENVLDGATLDGEEPPAGEEARIMATALPEENPKTVAETPVETTSKGLANNTDNQIIDGDVTNTSSPLTFSGNGTYTLTVNGTLRSDIRVTGGATLTINGAGKIIGTGTSSVISILGSNSKVILGTENGAGPTVTGGKGSASPGGFNNGAGTVGGGVFVNDGASFIMHSGAITKNEAGVGGGVFVWNGCHFEMTGGEISSNKAKDPDKTDDSDGPLRAHEGGGIFTDAKDTKITGGSIINNETETTTDWGGGGIYINNNGTLMIPSALITNNSAAGLGGGVAGCPHAKIIIGEKETTSAGQLESSAAVFKNTASGTSYPLNTVLRFNVPASVVSSGKNVPSGDFFLTGMGEGEIAKLLNGENPGNVVDGKLTYGWSTKYTLENKDYASKSFKVDLAQDYYCTLASYVSADNTLVRGDGETLAWRGFEVGMPPVNGCSVSDTGLWSREIGIPVGQSYESHDATLCLTNTATADNVNIARSVIITGNKSGTHGGGIACNGAIKFGKFDTEEKTTVNPYTVSLTKKIVNSLGDLLDIGSDDVFRFELTDKETNETYEGYTENGDLKFILPGFSTEGPKEKTFSLKEILTNEQKDAGFVSSIPDGIDVHVSLNVKKEVASYKEKDNNVLLTSTTYTTTVNSVQIGNQSGDDAATVTNTLDLKTSVNIPVTKIADGIAANTFTFGLKDVTANIDSLVDQAGNKITLKNSVNLAEQALTASDETATIAVADSTSEVVSGTDAKTFKFNYAPTTAEETHWYVIAEQPGATAGVVYDTTAYVVKVTVAEDAANTRNLTATGTVLGYADDINSPLNPLTLPEGELPAFYNTDTYDLISAASYSVYAASGEPVDQVCYVDPKIVKNLEGRAIKSGEFAFKLIQVANYNDTEGELISATTNDEFGMVDFDKANNVSGDLENPSCLAYTKPGTYYYRVIEDTSKGGMNDQSVLYSDQVITFTTVIEQDEATGQLVCTDMYYGWWDAAANQNVRFDEQYADYETQPGNIGDMSKLNPDWHPTIHNKARPMDLQVRKTSVSDRDEGLVGATYALYMVNENPQGDIWLAEATSEEGGWITYKNVSLATNNLYYFKETAAPAGHTVSEFRSPYFYLVEDATSANGYALKYTDTKYFDAAETEAAAAPLAAAEAQALQAAIAAQAEATAADDQTKPGHSADGNILLTYDKDGGVYDETTQIEVNKLDTRTHEWVEGAKLVILDKESGKEVASWTSGKAPQKLAKTLNVGTTYLLREVEAPGEYRLANDVEFVIDNYGNVTITKGTENGNAELSDNTITLYDTMMDAEEVEQREHETTREVPLGTILAQTGDMLPILGIGLIVLASLIALIVAGRRRRAGKDDEN